MKTTTIQLHGDEYAVVIDQSVLDAMGITSETLLEVSVQDGSLVITPIRAGLGTNAIAASLRKLRSR